ncbi:MAG: phosphatidylglycerophosphatase A family protein [Deltaproteobacteria bacterium]
MPISLARLLAEFFYLGRSKVAPGTAGTLGAIPLYYYLSVGFSPLAYFLLLGVFIILSVWAAGRASSASGEEDPQWVVIDEVAGYLVTMFLIAPTLLNIALGFILFRLFDIVKPPPARRFESLPGGIGIVADDVMAGIYANAALQILTRIIG